MSSSLADPLGTVRVIAHMLERARELGLTLNCSNDIAALAALKLGVRGELVSPIFDPQVTALDGDRAFWMSANNDTGACIAMQAFRLDQVYPDLAEWVLGWVAGLYIKRNELVLPAATEPPKHSHSHRLKGALVYHGEMWIDRSVRKREWFDMFLKLGILLAHLKWRPDAVWALITNPLATRGYVARSGYALQERGFLQWQSQWSPHGADESEWLVVAERSHLDFLIAEEVSRLS